MTDQRCNRCFLPIVLVYRMRIRVHVSGEVTFDEFRAALGQGDIAFRNYQHQQVFAGYCNIHFPVAFRPLGLCVNVCVCVFGFEICTVRVLDFGRPFVLSRGTHHIYFLSQPTALLHLLKKIACTALPPPPPPLQSSFSFLNLPYLRVESV